ncbi:myosin light chain kinase 3 isoform X2 [Megalops cyprinoides]|uniref:myosin light chain kinase 3 isoform X2 n=1 Tax=Megalops cyprinoides TaxID=118141 RepID=UPI001865108C|nr:myosin light chain kinase 3 isoform X2 [Megalops cyprinoides]XP_036399537.1 myosin light chain kinase 3 isoform X2 [Megalops cyprinoides]
MADQKSSPRAGGYVMGMPLHRSLLLSTGGFSVSDYIQRFTIKEDKGARSKGPEFHRGVQVHRGVHVAANDDSQPAEVSRVAVKSTGHGTKPTVPNQQGPAPSPLTSGPCLASIPAGQQGTRRTKEVTLRSRAPTRTQTFDKDTQDSGPGVGDAEGAVATQPQEGNDRERAAFSGVEGVVTATAGEENCREIAAAGPLRSESGLFTQEPVVKGTPLAAGEERQEEEEEKEERRIPTEKVVPPVKDEDTSSKEDAVTVEPLESVAVVIGQNTDSSRTTGVPKPDSECKIQWVPSLSQNEPAPSGPAKTAQSKLGTVGESSEAHGNADSQTGAAKGTLVSSKSVTPGGLWKSAEKPLKVIDDCPPLPAPFEHRIVSAKQVPMGSYYALNPNEVLGGGRFGQVHKCSELSSGLTLAAKIIKVKSMKDRDEVKNEISVMNQLNHVNLIQLYDAFETRTNLTLVMEYVEGGELFERIVDENYQLTELDAIVFVRQICEGVQYLHQQYILHLDLKPENILCVSTTGNQIKIIDFGLARKYRPREKLRVHFGTPEFLAPEVVNYDFVSFPTDMWSVGVITYMLLSGLSPFLGDNDTETMNNILHSNWDFDAEAFENVSEEAKDFISRLLIPEKCSRLSATGCMKHSWLNNLEEKAKMRQVQLKSLLRLQRYLAAHRQWKKHFYAVAAANRLKKFRQNRSINPA